MLPYCLKLQLICKSVTQTNVIINGENKIELKRFMKNGDKSKTPYIIYTRIIKYLMSVGAKWYKHLSHAAVLYINF